VKLGKRTLAIVVGLVVVVGGTLGWLSTLDGKIALMKAVTAWKHPVGPNQPVVWQQGPAVADKPAGERAPNIIVILADDLGYNDLAINGGGVADGAVPTPNINSIAHEGANLTDGYAGNATCAPSRAAIMTGRYATRVGYEFTPAGVLFSRTIAGFDNRGAAYPPVYHPDAEANYPTDDKIGVPSSEIMVPELLKKKGYHSLIFGKWHLGEGPGMTPTEQGYDEFLGFLIGAQKFDLADSPNVVNAKQDFDPIDKFLWAALPFSVQYNNGPRFHPDEYMTDYLGDQAVAAIDANKNRPFFMYLSFNAPHTPLQALKSDYDSLPGISDHRLRVYAAMIKALDRNVGKVLEKLKADGLDENTVIIFTSDNGGAHYIGLPEINKPYRGWKATFFEGGLRVPYFIKWPRQIAPGTVFNEPVGHVDIFATAAAAADIALPTDRQIDGVNLLPYLAGRKQGRPHETLYWRSGHYKVMLDGDWKLLEDGTSAQTWLFNLKDDPTEQTNLAATEPARLAEVKAALDKLDGEQSKPLWPALIEFPIAIDHTLEEPVKKGDEYIYWSN